jgi:hypothetical protein
MRHSTLTHPFLAACGLAWTAAACGSGELTGSSQDPGNLDGGRTDGGRTDGGRTNDAGVDASNANDASAPATAQCAAGDRSEYVGAIPNTTLTVAVCSKCGASYVVAANSSSSPADVSVNNGSTTVMATVPAGGTAMTAPLADNPADGTVSVCSTTGSSSCLSAAPRNNRYCNPYRDVATLAPKRIDQGVDYGGAGPIYAMGPGTIDVYRNRNDSGWPSGTFVSYQLTAGPASGKTIYLAENLDLNPALQSGSFVYSGTVLGTMVNAYPYTESGWGVPGAGYTAEHSCYSEGCTTALGTNFNQLLMCTGAPSGIAGSQTSCCPSASGWPTDWCPLLATWQ